jgi:tetratricopeptide (TPR) repeat protein
MGSEHVSNNYFLFTGSDLDRGKHQVRAFHASTWSTSALVQFFLPIFLLLPLLARAQNPPFQARARRIYQAALARYKIAHTNATAAWEFGRAAYDLADLLTDDRERSEAAQAGIDACRQAVALDINAAPAHYYLALNLGESARAKKLGALKLLHEMEHELLKAAELDPAFDYGGPDRALGLLYLKAPPWPASVGNRNKARARLEAAVELSPDYPDNHLSLAEAYAQWGEVKNLERELSLLDLLLPKAHARFAGENWAADWADWEERLQKLHKSHKHLAANPRISPAERGARQPVK